MILLLDTDPSARDVIRIFLQREGFEVLAAASLKEGLQLVAERRRMMDALILDIRLPGISGIEACVRFRRLPMTRNLPIIVCSSRSDMHTVAQCLRAGATDFVAKPFTGLNLVRAVQQHLPLAQTA